MVEPENVSREYFIVTTSQDLWAAVAVGGVSPQDVLFHIVSVSAYFELPNIDDLDLGKVLTRKAL